MPATYDAVLRDNQIEWSENSPEVAPGEALRVQVTVVGEGQALNEDERQAEIIKTLGELAAQGGIMGIPDPAAWQREIREDRDLPGR